MKRMTLILSAVAAILIVVLFWLMLWTPKQDELVDLQAQTENVRAQQAQLQARINSLRSVRERAPEVEAELAAAEAIIPRGAAQPAALRQLQLAADEAGATMPTISLGRPASVADAPATLGQLSLNVQLTGTYFQVVDFLRRVEEPAITPRGITWSSLSLSISDYPDLNVTLQGRMFANLSEPAPAEPDQPEPSEDEDADVEIEISAPMPEGRP